MMKNIGLVIADKNEVFQIKNWKHLKTLKINCFEVDQYQIDQLNIFVINSGIGIVNASIATQFLITHFQVEAIWNYGAVGASEKLKVFETIIPKHFYFYDVKTPWYLRGQVPGEPAFFKNNLKANRYNLATGHSFIYQKDQLAEIQSELNVDLFDMEATAIAQTCYKNEIPFYCIKAISDIIGKTTTDNNDINQAIQIAGQKALEKMLTEIDKLYLQTK